MGALVGLWIFLSGTAQRVTHTGSSQARCSHHMLTQGEPLIKFDDGSGELPLGGLVCGLLLILGGLLLLGSPAALLGERAAPAPRAPPGARAEQALAEPHLGAWAVTFRHRHSSPPRRLRGGDGEEAEPESEPSAPSPLGGGVLELD